MRHIGCALLLSVWASASIAAEPIQATVVRLPIPTGSAMLNDGVTLVVSQADKAELVYFDTIKETEIKRVQLDFRPGNMAVRGNTLYVGVSGGSLLYAIDAQTGGSRQEIVLGGGATAIVECHREKGPIFVSTRTAEVFSVDPSTARATKTSATGIYLAVDPVSGSSLFTGMQPSRGKDVIYIEDLPGGGFDIYWDRWGVRAFMLKYAVRGNQLKLVSSQENAAVNAYGLSISPDGKKLMMPSGGGWRPPAPEVGGSYRSAVFSAANLKARVGEVLGSRRLAFHPVLNLGVAATGTGTQIQFFNPKSLISGKSYQIAKEGDARCTLLTFGAKGTKVIVWNGENTRKGDQGLQFISIPDLTDADRTALAKVYGKLPPPPAVIVANTTRSDAPFKPEPAKPSPMPTTPASADPAPPEQPLPNGLIASAGFNRAKGMNHTKGPNFPYPADQGNVQAGFGEPGWAGSWSQAPKGKYVSNVVGEGDGALRLDGTQNFGRYLKIPRKEPFLVELMINCPSKGGGEIAMWEVKQTTTGPEIKFGGSGIYAWNGNGSGRGSWINVSGAIEYDKWYKLTLLVNVPKQTWRIAVDGKPHEKELGFKYKPKALTRLNFLVRDDKTAYYDAVKIWEP